MCAHSEEREPEKHTLTEICQIFEDQAVIMEELETLATCKPELCAIDHLNILHLSLRYSTATTHSLKDFANMNLTNYMSCIAPNKAGFYTRSIVLVIGYLGFVHRKLMIIFLC